MNNVQNKFISTMPPTYNLIFICTVCCTVRVCIIDSVLYLQLVGLLLTLFYIYSWLEW